MKKVLIMSAFAGMRGYAQGVLHAPFDEMGASGGMTAAVFGIKQVAKAPFDDMGASGGMTAAVLGTKQVSKAPFDDMGASGVAGPNAISFEQQLTHAAFDEMRGSGVAGKKGDSASTINAGAAIATTASIRTLGRRVHLNTAVLAAFREDGNGGYTGDGRDAGLSSKAPAQVA